MSIKILCDMENTAVLYFSVTEDSFGYLIHGDDKKSGQEIAEDFLVWIKHFDYFLGHDTFGLLFAAYNAQVKLGIWPLNIPEEEL